LTYGVYRQGPGVFPVADQIEYYMVFPAIMVALIGVSAWVANSLQRWFVGLAIIAVIALFALMPFLFAYTGGV
jgi:hypothetical protein